MSPAQPAPKPAPQPQPQPKKDWLLRVSKHRGMRVIVAWAMGLSCLGLLLWPLGLFEQNTGDWLGLIIGGYILVGIFGWLPLGLQRLLLYFFERYIHIHPAWYVRLLLLEVILMGLLAMINPYIVQHGEVWLYVALPPVLPALVSGQYRHDV